MLSKKFSFHAVSAEISLSLVKISYGCIIKLIAGKRKLIYYIKGYII